VLVPGNTRLSEREAVGLLAQAAPRLLITDPAHRTVRFDEVVGLVRIVPEGESPDADSLLGDPRAPRDPEPGQWQSIMFTSGTTGRPKGAILTLEQHWWNAVGSLLRLGHAPDDTWLLSMPLYHVGGQAILFRAAIGGTRVLFMPRFQAEAVARLMASGTVTLVSLVPTMLARVLAAYPGRFSPRLRAVLIGGAACPPALAAEARARGLPVALTYGMTETASQMATEEPGRPSGGSGHPLHGVLLAVAEPDAEGAGEILVRGPQVTPGYWRDPEATQRAMTEDGWFRTGDIGRISADGVVTVLDRRSDLVVTGGENVYPAEVEAVLLEHPAVREAAVAGVPDPEWGHLVAAWVVSERPLDWAELEQFCRERLAGFKVPRRWFRVDRLPRTASGKVQRRLLVAEALAGREVDP
jgi:O-succinylbenzoic acid--CoA ligase